MTTPSIHIVNKRILAVITDLKEKGEIFTYKEIWEEMGLFRQNVYAIKQGLGSFTLSHVYILCTRYGVNPSYIMGLEESMYTEKQVLK